MGRTNIIYFKNRGTPSRIITLTLSHAIALIDILTRITVLLLKLMPKQTKKVFYFFLLLNFP